jgi:hypothetical protein
VLLTIRCALANLIPYTIPHERLFVGCVVPSLTQHITQINFKLCFKTRMFKIIKHHCILSTAANLIEKFVYKHV